MPQLGVSDSRQANGYNLTATEMISGAKKSFIDEVTKLFLSCRIFLLLATRYVCWIKKS